MKNLAYIIMSKRPDGSMPKFCKIMYDKIYFTKEEAETAKKEAKEKRGVDCFRVFEILVEVIREV